MSLPDANGPAPGKSTHKPWHQDSWLLSGVWIFMACVYVIGGAYDTDDFTLLHRIVFWVLVSALIVFQPALIERAIARHTPATRTGAWMSSVIAVIITIPIVSIELHLMKSTPLLPRAADPWIEFIPFVAMPVVTVASFVLFLRFSWERRYLDQDDLDPGKTTPETRHSALIGPETLYVRSQDHYLEIVNTTGRRFVRGRLTDLASSGQAYGFSPHRSWWVADQSVKASERRGRDVRLLLSDGTCVPVSRSRLEGARSRGWM